MTPETRTALTAILAPYVGRMSREDAIRGILESGPMKATCPHCGRQDCDVITQCRHPWTGVVCISDPLRYPGADRYAHASDREDYLTEEAEVGDEKSAWWKALAWAYQAVYQATVKELEAAQGRARKWRKQAKLWKGQAVGEVDHAALHARERDEARAQVRDAALVQDDLRAEIDVLRAQRDEARADAKRWAVEAENGLREPARVVDERDEARADLDALRVRARGMREDLLDAGVRFQGHGYPAHRKYYTDAAGEPIP